MRTRLPLAPATLRAGGWISAGMISTVQTPLPILAAICASDWPQRCAPSPESLTISMTVSLSFTAGLAPLARGDGLAVLPVRSRVVVSLMVSFTPLSP